MADVDGGAERSASTEKEEEPRTVTADELIERYNTNAKDLRGLLLEDGRYSGIRQSLSGARLDGVNLFRAVLQGLDLSKAILRGANATRAECIGTDFSGADLRGATLNGADLSSANLRGADLRGCDTTNLKLAGARVAGMKIDRHGLRVLGSGHGGLTEGDLASLDVEDDQAKLAMSFGGFWTWLHLLAVTLFVLPYVAYAAERYVATLVRPCPAETEACAPLRTVLVDYVLSGGRGDGIDVTAVLIFVLLLSYNALRISLVYKARALALAEVATTVPRRFKLSGYWRFAYVGCQVLVWFNLALIVFHTYQLMSTSVRLPA